MPLASLFKRRTSQPAPTPARIALREDTFRGIGKTPLKVDREKGIIYGVKILGWESDNGRKYDPAGVCQCKALYEGKPSDVDHTTKGNPNPEARNAWHENIQCREDGLYSDYHLLNPASDLSIRVMSAAEQNPSLFGFSHDADGERDPRDPNLIRRILEVRSIDLVTRPATTDGLYESQGNTMSKITMKTLLESQRQRFSKNRLGYMTRLIEDDSMPMDTEVAPAADASPDAALAAGFEASATAIVKAAIAGDMTAEDAVAKIEQLLTTHDALTASDEPDPVEEDDETPADDKDKKKKDQESRNANSANNANATKLPDLETVLTECDAAGYTPSGPARRALRAMESKTDRKAFIDEQRKLTEANGQPRRGPRSSAPTSSERVVESKLPEAPAALADALRSY